MATSNRYRPWTIIFYGSQKELFSILHTYACRIAHYAFIYHDKDEYEVDEKNNDGEIVHKKGELKKPHFHIVVDFYNTCTFTAVKKLFTTKEDNPRVANIVDRVAQYEYLWHKNNPEKYQYDKEAVISDDINYYENLCLQGDKRETDNIAEAIINDLLRGVSPRLMVNRYGRDFVIHMRQYQDCVDEIRQYEVSHRPSLQKAVRLEPIQEEMECPFE